MSTQQRYDDLGYIVASKYRRTVLDSLARSPATPSAIVGDCGHKFAHISRALRELRERDLVELLVPEERKKGRIYGVTDRGERVHELLIEQEVRG